MNNSEILALANLRVDGRKPCDLRKVRYNFGVEESADGSVYYEQVKPNETLIFYICKIISIMNRD